MRKTHQITLWLFVLLLTSTMIAAKKERGWKTGTVVATAYQKENAPPSIAIGASPAAAAAAMAISKQNQVQGFAIRGEDFDYIVSVPVGRRRPNVTVHGAVKYTLERGVFYLLDDDGKQFTMTILQKSALPPAKEKL